MNEFEETLNRVLSDPAELEKLSRLAGQLFGNGGAAEAAEERAEPGMAERLGQLMSGLGGTEDDKAGLLKAIAPYLREDRRRKLQRAMRLARAARLAGVAFREFGGEDGAV